MAKETTSTWGLFSGSSHIPPTLPTDESATSDESDHDDSNTISPPKGYFVPVEFPLTSFASTPHNVACISFLLGGLATWGLVLASNFIVTKSLLWSPTASASSLVPQNLWNAATSPMLGTYLACWAVFHLLEFVVTSMYNAGKLEVSSFLLNNGAQYHIAHLFGITEHILEEAFLPAEYRKYKHVGGIVVLGAVLIFVGQFMRSGAMIQASSNFSHKIAFKKLNTHELVKTGVYSWSRHPSYAGFVWWALGTQVLLGNPIGVLLFALTLQSFFSERIREEEKLLVKFFGKEYEEYRKEVPTRLLFIP